MDTLEARGGVRSFPSTHWSQIYLASDRLREEGARALGELIQTYRTPLQHRLQRRFSVPPEKAGEWLDSFIEQRVLQKDLLRQAAQANGRFRWFLITSIERFVVDRLRREGAARRCPSGGWVDLDTIKGHETPRTRRPHADASDRDWAVTVIDQAAARTEAYYRSKGKARAWEVFQEAIYLPKRYGTERPSDAALAVQFGLRSTAHASSTIRTVKQKFGESVREVVAKYVPVTANIDAEIQELMAILAEAGE